MSRLRISEIFASIQGEGIWTGVPSVFIRVSGCNLRCIWCDTPYASWTPEGPHLTLDEILEKTRELAGASIRHIVLTGGEPMLFEPVVTLCEELKAQGFTITIETAGTIFRSLPCDLMSISPKLANSDPPAGSEGVATLHATRRADLSGFISLTESYDCQLKFVVNPEENLADQLTEISAIVAQAKGTHPVLLMPEGTDVNVLRRREALLVPVCMERGWRLAARRHIEWFGNTRGT